MEMLRRQVMERLRQLDRVRPLQIKLEEREIKIDKVFNKILDESDDMPDEFQKKVKAFCDQMQKASVI